MKTLTNEKELFALFVNEENEQDFIQKPFYNSKYDEVWATNTHILLRIKKYKNKPDLTKDFPCIENDNEINKVLLIDELKAKLQDVKWVDEIKEIKCKECNGTGNVKWEYYSDKQQCTYDSDFDCPVCDGFGYSPKRKTGKKVIAEGEDIFMDEVRFAAKYINVLVQAAELLGVREVKWTNGGPNTGNTFELNEDVLVLIMPKTR